MKKISLALLACATAFAISPAAAWAEPMPMVVSAPEGGSNLPYLLVAGAVCLGAIFFRSRYRFGSRA